MKWEYKMVFIIGIAGPSCCGKSTICDELQKHLKDSFIIHTDDYWHDPETFPKEKGFKNWELPECIDFDTLYVNLSDLKKGKTTTAPQWVRGGYPPLQKEIKPSPIIIVEGFRLFWDERVRKILDFRIYIDVPEGLIIRRRVERMRHPGKVGRELYYREIVIPEERKYGVPTKAFADLVVDGGENTIQIVDQIKIKLQTVL